MREPVPLAGALPVIDADEAWRRLGRLTKEQRAVVVRTLIQLSRS